MSHTKIGVGAVAVALGIGAAVTPTPAVAAPAESGARMFVYTDPADPKNTRVTIEGVYPMLQADAVGYLNNIYTGKQPGGMEYRVVADDNGEGDTGRVTRWIAGNGSFDGYRLEATPEGIHHMFIFYVPTSLLNEDDSFTDGDDELYAKATFVDADGGRRTQISNVVNGRF